jgi:hypothetical protein
MPRVDGGAAFRPQVLGGNAGDNCLLQPVQPVCGETTNPQRVDVPPIRMFRQIAFVQKQDVNSIRRDVLERGRLWFAPIHHVKKEISAGERFLGPGDSFALDFIRGIAQPGRVEQSNRDPAQVNYLFDRVARGAGLFADDGPVVAEKPVEQTRFARVCGTIDNGAHTFAQNSALLGRREKLEHSLAD